MEKKGKAISVEEVEEMMKKNETKMLQSTRLLKKQKELAAVQETLDEKMSEYRRRMTEYERRRKILNEKACVISSC